MESTQGSEAETENNLVINEDIIEQSTCDDSLLGEALKTQQSKGKTVSEGITIVAILQDRNSNDLLIPKDEFALLNDPDSLGEIIIYDMAVEYQGIITSTIRAEEDVIEIKVEQIEQDPMNIVLENPTNNPVSNKSNDEPEPTTLCQVLLSQVVAMQDFGIPSDEELEEWAEVSKTRTIDEPWGRDSVHEEDMALITRDRTDPTPTNNDCISNIQSDLDITVLLVA